MRRRARSFADRHLPQGAGGVQDAHAGVVDPRDAAAARAVWSRTTATPPSAALAWPTMRRASRTIVITIAAATTMTTMPRAIPSCHCAAVDISPATRRGPPTPERSSSASASPRLNRSFGVRDIRDSTPEVQRAVRALRTVPPATSHRRSRCRPGGRFQVRAKTSSGRKAPTTQFGASTTSWMRRSQATETARRPPRGRARGDGRGARSSPAWLARAPPSGRARRRWRRGSAPASVRASSPRRTGYCGAGIASRGARSRRTHDVHRRLDRGAAHLAVAHRRVGVADREQGALDADRQIERRAGAQVLDVEVAAPVATAARSSARRAPARRRRSCPGTARKAG